MTKESARIKRHVRLRQRVIGTAERPRLCVHRSLKNLEAQIIDDLSRKTILSLSTMCEAVKDKFAYGGNLKAAAFLGELLAEAAKTKGISRIAFDRGGYPYHGRIKALADAVRKGGIAF